MTPMQITQLIPNIVSKRKMSPTDRWILIIVDNEIKCIPMDGDQAEGFPLMPITMKHIGTGISGREWDRLTNRIHTYQKTHPDFYAEPIETPAPEKKKHKRSKKKTEPETNAPGEPNDNETKTDTDSE